MPFPYIKAFRKTKDEPRLVLPEAPRVDPSAQRSDPTAKTAKVDVIIYKWHKTYKSLRCPNCDAEIKQTQKYCKSCGWVMEDR